MKTEVYSWRLPEELKTELEQRARRRKVPVSSILDVAVRDWLKKNDGDAEGDEAQRRLHAAAASCFGVLAGSDSRRAETAREAVRDRLRKRHAR
jgi:hypothetical protein